MADDLHPIAILIEELQDEDIQVRAATKKTIETENARKKISNFLPFSLRYTWAHVPRRRSPSLSLSLSSFASVAMKIFLREFVPLLLEDYAMPPPLSLSLSLSLSVGRSTRVAPLLL